MHELLREGADARPWPDAVRVVRAGEVAAVRRSSPDSAIVALVRSGTPAEAITAQLAGADVVLPYTDENEPAEAVLDAARYAARTLAERARTTRENTRAAAHEFAGNASAVAIAAHLLGADDAPRAVQLQRVSTRGAELAWLAGRVARTAGTCLEVLDLTALVRDICRGEGSRRGLDLRVDANASVPALIDRARLSGALSALLDNSQQAGATLVTVQVGTELSGTSDRATVTVVDDGRGLPEPWSADEALKPFVSGWSAPSAGLGLAEAGEFAADMGGALQLRPRSDGPGVRATLQFPGVPQPDAGGVAARGDIAGEQDWSLASILEGIARRDPVEQSLEALVATMEQYLPGSVCSILLLDQDTATLQHGAGARLPPLYREAIDGLQIGPVAGSCGTAAFTRQEVVAADISTDERWAGYRHHALLHGLRACWSRPILDVERGVVLGTFAVYHHGPWAPGPAATELVQRLTHVAAVAIGTAALHGQLVESEARFRSTFEAAGLGIALVSPAGTIQDANAALTTMAGRPLVGESIAGLFIDDDAAATQRALAAVLARPDDDQNLATAEVRVRRVGPGSEPVWAAMSGSLIRGPAGEPRHFCIELFDLTERRLVGQARHERELAEAADRAKSELLALVSHEVRTPLHAVIGFAQTLQSMPLSPEHQQQGLDHILGAGRHLLQLINDLLDVAGAETGQLQLVPDRVAPQDVVHEAMEIVAVLAAERRISLQAQTVSNGPPVWVDRHRLRQVLLNLLGNAIKFTPVGGAVEIVVGTNELLVTDTGPGIAAEQQPFLFTPFHRGDTSSATGSGLGLALSQRLMRVMHGDLTLVASSAAGTTFRLVLPAAPGEGRAASESESPSDSEPAASSARFSRRPPAPTSTR